MAAFRFHQKLTLSFMLTVSHQPFFVSYPLALLAAFFACGIITGQLLAPTLPLSLTCGLICSILAVAFFARGALNHAALLTALAFFFAGATLLLIEKQSVAIERVQRMYDEGVVASDDPVEVAGVLDGQPEIAPDGLHLALRVEKLRFKENERVAAGTLLLFAPIRDSAQRSEYDQLDLRYGARLNVMTRLQRADDFRNPGVSSFTEYLEQRNVDASGLIKSPLLIERLGDERVFAPLLWLYQWRERLLMQINERFSNETAGVLNAAVLGNRFYLSQATSERFREGGTFHVLVISGLHISFIGGLALVIARRVTKRRKWQIILSVPPLWMYALAVGAESSVLRAALMFTIVTLATIFHRQAASLNALGATALCLLVRQPNDLFDPSFQLTFLSVLSIVALAWPLLQRLQTVGAWHPTLETPYPPRCSRVWRALGEMIYWSERAWRREMERAPYRYKLFKTVWAVRFERWRVQSLLRYAFTALFISASVQITLLPLLVVYFHRLSIASLILNVWVGALMACLSITALITLFLSNLSIELAALCAALAEWINWLMVHGVDPFMRRGIASWRVPEYSGLMSAIYYFYYVPLIVFFVRITHWKPLKLSAPVAIPNALRFAHVNFIAALFIIIFHPLSAERPDGKLRVDFLDVGQGDAALVTMPNGTTLLIDGGGRPKYESSALINSDVGDEQRAYAERAARSIGEAVISEYLWWRGLDHIDYILATHADADHIQGLNDVARSFKVRAAFVARTPADNAEYMRFAATMRERKIPVHRIGRNDVLRFGETFAEILWPPVSEDDDAAVGGFKDNDASIVLRLRYKERTILMTGDIEARAEQSLARAKGDLRCDVMKVPHHGSRTSSTQTFINTTRPFYAVISVGSSSPFGHPHKEVVEHWRNSGAQVLTTGTRGTITVSTNGKDLNVETFIK
jgi:competence protein ComEC